jgi:hypothetical protein
MAGPSARGAAHQTSHVLREAAFRPSRFIDRTYHLSIREVKKNEKKKSASSRTDPGKGGAEHAKLIGRLRIASVYPAPAWHM